MKRKIKSNLSKIKFLLGRNPKRESNLQWRTYIPEKYKAVVTITADFELAWAPRYSRMFADALEGSLQFARRERGNVPEILNICDQYNIPITWATVGHLFLEGCKYINGKTHPDIAQLPKFENNYWKFDSNNWFEYDPCSNYKEAPEWYAPDLIDKILQARTKHEIGCHTFSHIDCRDEVCSDQVFNTEINKCKQLAAKKNLILNSFVHPAHTIGNLDNLSSLGFESFQTDPGNIFGYPKKHKNGLWELKRTYELDFRKDWSTEYHIYRYKKIIDRAIKYNAVCNFWFHPSFTKDFLHGVMPVLFDYINKNKNDVWVTTVGEYISWLKNQTDR